MDRIRNFILLLRGQLWILPALLGTLALGLAYFLLSNGAAILPSPSTDIWWLYSGDAGSAREVLSSLLSGLITMTSLVVSITFVILTLAASQLGPRLITTFIADRQIQTVLGLFLGTILYVLVVLRTLDEELGRQAVPHIAVTVGSGLTVVCLFALLWYVHKIARSIIADNVVKAVVTDLRRNIRDILPLQQTRNTRVRAPADWNEAASISLDHCGYIQTIGYDELVKIGRRKRVVISVDVRAGHFVLRHGPHVRVHPAGAVDERIVSAIRKTFVIGQERTPAQDLEYGIRQLVEIALRALSPGINDPFTGIAVVDRLGAALEEVLSRGWQPRTLEDTGGEVRVFANRTDIGGLVGTAFDMIRQAGSGHPSILIRVADVLGQLAPVLTCKDAREAVREQLRKLAETAGQGRLAPSDLDVVVKRIEAASASLDGPEKYGGSLRAE